ncbi:MAG: transcriptional regulator, TetR family [Streptosporangiaceae bacterium]|nr:transcriptional regulator, TetR family [Streptosporangiaceae bacterium]
MSGSGPTDADGELWVDIESATSRQLLAAGVAAFAMHGYHATTTREISRAGGLSPAAMYVHFGSKEELLYEISRRGHQAALRLVSECAASDPAADVALRTLVDSFVRWHAEHNVVARVVQYEQNALSAEHLQSIVALRRATERVVRDLVRRGMEQAVFDVPDIDGAALAILSLGIDVARWYRSGGSRSPEDLGALFAELSCRMVMKPPRS